jgi:predicted adenine nucleotide alpha hydrolase (AANH) superfamily ATPase
MNNIDTLEKYKNFIASNSEKKVKILIHACCAPCSSEVLNELKQHAEITIYYYNPNTYPYEEYMKRYDEFSKLPYKFDVINEQYNEQEYLDYVNEFKLLKEGSLRCYKCYELRLKRTAQKAKELGFDYFTTTLSISPYKNSKWINEIGFRFGEQYNVKFMYSDFKKNDGYKKSIVLSKEYNLYRQEYCGCRYSMVEMEERLTKKNDN